MPSARHMLLRDANENPFKNATLMSHDSIVKLNCAAMEASKRWLSRDAVVEFLDGDAR